MIPFAKEAPASESGPGLERLAAAGAEALGLPTVAAGLYERLLAHAHADRAELSVELATSLLDAGRPADARRVLTSAPGPRGSAWHLRMALAAVDLRQFDAARSEVRAVKASDLAPIGRPWFDYLQGRLAAAAGDPAQARALFRKAVAEAGNSLARATFLIADARQEILLGRPTDEMARKMAANAAQFHGTEQGYNFERTYALYLDALGRKADAVNILRNALLTIPPREAARADDFRLLLGLIGGAKQGGGRAALFELLEAGPDPDGPDRQRMALQLLAQASLHDPRRSQFRAELDRLIAAPGPSQVLDHLLLFRADLALDDRDDMKAESAAGELLEKFPGSALKPYALGILTAAAWNQGRYRAAATAATQTRDAFPPGETRSLLDVVAAEAWFRAGEYRAAADAYAAALRAAPATLPEGDLVFQRIEAEIRAGSLDAAESILDGSVENRAFDPADRWEAEYNLARGLQIDGRSRTAYERVSRLLATADAVGLDPDLRARTAWLQAEMAFDSGQYERTLELAGELPVRLAGVRPPLRTEIAAAGQLLRAKALSRLGRESAAAAVLDRLGVEYPATRAAIEAYLFEAEDYAAHDETVKAEQRLIDVVKRFPKDSIYAPYALLRAATLAESLGQPHDLEQAIRWIEQMVTAYPDSDLVFQARLKEGDLYRKSDQFPQAEQIYEMLIDNYGSDPDAILARLALADCHNEAASSDPSQADRAVSLYEDLVERIDAPIDVRVEAGYKLGNLYARLKRPSDAITTWFGEVVQPFLLEPREAALLGSRGRHWMARTLLDLGRLLQAEGRPDEARRAWERLVESGLPGADLARTDLASLVPAAPKS
ncbi:MAG: tetratricopeptide repeat protein [Opitutaceae bacterium]